MGETVIAVSALGEDSESDELQSLRQWLDDEVELSGAVDAGEGRAVPGTLGTVSDVLLITLGPGGVAGVFASVLITWIRAKTGSVSVVLRRPDGTELKLDARGLGALTSDQVPKAVQDLARWTETGPGAGTGVATATAPVTEGSDDGRQR
ncbi:hypothetical protein [Streptomyces sp. SID13726]|uniref:effector-associated constant component EACC1 n=1 Tax=Streptomyces sp. SID13726 TaxID=2706058 RepID=UPI0013BA7378|nr:hypothetical protein [Streptomyces sp. SID13726]NEA99127.1 hypothetical protein [Streptomyces sp. SID13726]